MDKQLRFASSQSLPLVHTMPRAVQNARILSRKVVVKETKNEAAGIPPAASSIVAPTGQSSVRQAKLGVSDLCKSRLSKV
jgi:hypothetical protein